MNVRCERCATEYEFDDALIAERGTSVQCTHCGHAFRVFRRGGQGKPDIWRVTTSEGRVIEYRSVRELQRGIVEQQVQPFDTLSRAGDPPRPLGSIAELDSFWGRGARGATQPGVAPPPTAGAASVKVAALAMVSVPPAHGPGQTLPPTQPEHGTRLPTDQHPGKASEAPPATHVPVPPWVNTSSANTFSTDTSPANTSPVNSSPHPAPTSRREPSTDASPAGSRFSPAPPSSAFRPSYDSFPDEEEPVDSRFHPGGARRVGSRWIAGVVLLGVTALFGASVGRKYLQGFTTTGAGVVAAPSDQRVVPLVERGRNLLEAGDLDGAKEAFDQASALAENDPGVRRGLARLEALRAELVWLKLKLMEHADPRTLEAVRHELGERVSRAERALTRAAQLAPEDPVLARCRVNVARVQGRVDEARRLVAPIAASPHLPENAYVLAALDLADQAPVWSTLLDRLRIAASAEREWGLSRVALTYALVQAGRLDEARFELDKVRRSKVVVPLLPELTEFVARSQPTAEPSSTGSATAALDAAAPRTGGPSLPADARLVLRDANKALARGDLSAAEALFGAVLDRRGEDTEALAGLAAVAELRRDPKRAARLYERVLAINPSYVPALLALADQKWAAGDRAGAIPLYRRVLDGAGPNTPHGRRAQTRLGQASEGEEAADESEPDTATVGEDS